MGNVHLVTGYAGKPHVTSSDQGSFNAALVGSEEYVLPKGKQFAATVTSSNIITVSDGDILMQGRHIRLNENSTVGLNIDNGQQGYLRNDLIVVRYTKDATTSIEDANLVVIKGTATTGNPADPAHKSGDIIGNGATEHDMPLYRVKLNGLDVQLEALFTVANTTPAKLLEQIQEHEADKTNPHNVTADQIGAAKATHNHAASAINSGMLASARLPTVPVSKGGIGKTSVTAGSYLAGDGTNAMIEKTPAQVLSDIGAVSAAGGKMTGNLTVEKASNPQVVLDNTGSESRAQMMNLGHALAISMANDASTPTTNQRAFYIRDTESDNGNLGSLRTALQLRDVVGGVASNYNVAHTGNLNDLGIARIATGTYKGNGKFGSGNPNSINFPFVPKMVAVYPSGGIGFSGIADSLFCYADESFVWFSGMERMRTANKDHDDVYFIRFSVSGNTLSWYCTEDDAYSQCNTTDKEFFYFGVG